MTTKSQIRIDPLSATSLYLESTVRAVHLGSATGFVVKSGEQHYLVTNWHVVAGKDPDTNRVLSPTGEIPNELRVSHHAKGRLGTWIKKAEPLYDPKGQPRWIEHPAGKQIDVVALPLHAMDGDVVLYPLDLGLAHADIVAEAGMTVFVIGYPLGLSTAGGWPIWKTAHIASDPDLDFKGLPAFIIDATTRGGMSGSPAVLRTSGGYRTRNGGTVMSVSHPVTLFLGVFSAHIEAAEIGLVWRARLIDEILSQASA